jgi:hypothetical protein
MKKKTTTRTVSPPKGSRGSARKGLTTLHTETAETSEDIDEVANSTKSTYDPLYRLSRLLDSANHILKDLPGPIVKYELLPNRTWRLLPDDAHSYTTGIPADSPLIDPLSPEYFALKVRLWCRQAIKRIEKADFEGAIIPIMDAHEAYWQMKFTDQFEYKLTGKLASEKAASTADRTNHWAMAFAASLFSRDLSSGKKPSFKPVMAKLLDGDQPGLHAGLEIHYEAVTGILSAHDAGGKLRGTLSENSFRTDYFTKI